MSRMELLAQPTSDDGLVVVASPFRGYPLLGMYEDVEYNRQKAREILYKHYWLNNKPALALVLQCDYLEHPTEEDDQKAREWCFKFISVASEVHFWYPDKCGFTRGIKAEYRLAIQLKIPRISFPQEEW